MFATIHMRTSAKHSDIAWLVTRASAWSTRRTASRGRRRPGAIAQAEEKLSMRRVSTSHTREASSKNGMRGASIALIFTRLSRHRDAGPGSARPVRKYSSVLRAIGAAACAPKPPFSTSTAIAIFGLSAGAYATNHA
jgi:hypothetical protein